MKRENHTLHVIEVNSTPLAGANTAIAAMQEYYPGLMVDDATLDLPALAVQVVEVAPGFPDMTVEERGSRLARIGYHALVEMVANKPSVVEERGRQELVNDEVTQGWADDLWQSYDAQLALIGGLRSRLEVARDNGVSVLALKGGSADAVRRLPGMSLLQRQHYYCEPIEAAWRSCEAAQLPLTEDFGVRYFKDQLVRFRREKIDQHGTHRERWGGSSRAVSLWQNPWGEANTISLMQERGLDIDALGLRSRAVPVGAVHEEFRNRPNAKGAARDVGSPYGRRIAINTAPFRATSADPALCRSAFMNTVTQLFAEAMSTLAPPLKPGTVE